MRLGDRLEVSAIGYGSVGLTPGMYGEVDEQQAVAAVRHALDLGVSLIDTADAYGAGHSETVVGRAIAGRRDEVVVSTKFGQLPKPGAERRIASPWGADLLVDGRPENVRGYAEDSLRRLGVDVIDLYYLHWPDPVTPIEETVGAMAELVEAGLVRHLGLSNPSGEHLRRAASVHPITAVQVEWSLWARDVEADIVGVARTLQVGVVAWAPLGAGFLAGSMRNEPDDFRRGIPRFSPEHLARNNRRYDSVRAVAGELGVSPSKLALAWLMHQDPPAVPIPGSRNLRHVEENAAAADLQLDAHLLARIDQAIRREGLAVPDPAPVVSSGQGHDGPAT